MITTTTTPVFLSFLICLCVREGLHAVRGQRPRPQYGFSGVSTLLFVREVRSQAWRSLIRVGRLISEPQGSSVSVSHCYGYKYGPLCLAFSCRCWGLNTGLRVCTTHFTNCSRKLHLLVISQSTCPGGTKKMLAEELK